MIIFLDICLRAYLNSARDAGSDPGVEVTNAALAARSMCAWFDAVERWTLLIAERGRIYLQIWHDFLEELQPAWNTISTQWIATLEISSKTTCVSAPVRRHAAVKAKLQTPSLLS